MSRGLRGKHTEKSDQNSKKCLCPCWVKGAQAWEFFALGFFVKKAAPGEGSRKWNKKIIFWNHKLVSLLVLSPKNWPTPRKLIFLTMPKRKIVFRAGRVHFRGYVKIFWKFVILGLEWEILWNSFLRTCQSHKYESYAYDCHMRMNHNRMIGVRIWFMSVWLGVQVVFLCVWLGYGQQ